MKVFTLCFCVAFLIGASFLINTDAKNITWGYIRPGDFLLHRDFVVKSSSWMQVISKDVLYPPKGYASKYNISAVFAIDHKRKDGGNASLIRGGPGYRNATVLLKSDRNHGLNYTIEFFGR